MPWMAATFLFLGRIFVFAKERNGGGIVMQFVQLQTEFANHLTHHIHQQLRLRGVKQPIQTAAHAIVVQLAQLPLRQSQQIGRVTLGPFSQAIDRLSRQQHISHQQQQATDRGNFDPRIVRQEVLLKNLLQPHPFEQSIDDGQRAYRPGLQDSITAAGTIPGLRLVAFGGLLTFSFLLRHVSPPCANNGKAPDVMHGANFAKATDGQKKIFARLTTNTIDVSRVRLDLRQWSSTQVFLKKLFGAIVS